MWPLWIIAIMWTVGIYYIAKFIYEDIQNDKKKKEK